MTKVHSNRQNRRMHSKHKPKPRFPTSKEDLTLKLPHQGKKKIIGNASEDQNIVVNQGKRLQSEYQLTPMAKKQRLINESDNATFETLENNEDLDSLIKTKDTHHFEHESQAAMKKEVKIEPSEAIITQDFRKEFEDLKAETQHWKTKCQSLQDRVTPLENEVETMKKQIQELLKLKTMLTKDQNQSNIVDVNEKLEAQPLNVEIEIKKELPEILIEDACSDGTVVINENHLNTFGKT